MNNMYTVMIIDDDATCLSITKALLEDEYNVQIMRSGLQALGYLKSFHDVDLILLDMIMPGADGMRVLQELKNDPKLCDIPVIFLTSMDGMDFQAKAFSAGACDFLEKPVHEKLMKIKIKRQLEIAKLKKEHAQMKQCLTVIDNAMKALN